MKIINKFQESQVSLNNKISEKNNELTNLEFQEPEFNR